MEFIGKIEKSFKRNTLNYWAYFCCCRLQGLLTVDVLSISEKLIWKYILMPIFLSISVLCLLCCRKFYYRAYSFIHFFLFLSSQIDEIVSNVLLFQELHTFKCKPDKAIHNCDDGRGLCCFMFFSLHKIVVPYLWILNNAFLSPIFLKIEPRKNVQMKTQNASTANKLMGMFSTPFRSFILFSSQCNIERILPEYTNICGLCMIRHLLWINCRKWEIFSIFQSIDL